MSTFAYPLSHRPNLAAILLAVLAGATSAQEKDARAALPKIPPPDAEAAWVPDGFEVEVALSELMYPSSVAFDDEGTMFVAECGYMPGDTTQPARILRIDLSDPEDLRRELASAGLVGPITDLLWHDGKLFVSHKGKISVLEKGQLRDLVTDLPSQGDHSNNQLALGPDGRLYFGQGSATNSGVVGEDNHAFGWVAKHPEVCERPAKDITLRGQEFESTDPRAKDPSAKVKTSAFQPFGKTVPDGTVVKGTTKANGTILSCELDGSDLAVHAWGFRNPYGVQWSKDGELYVADAGSDVRGSRPIEGSLEMLWKVKKDAWYGWPDFFAGVPVTDPRFKPKNGPTALYVVDIGPIHYVRGPKGPEPQAFPGTGVVWRIGRKGT